MENRQKGKKLPEIIAITSGKGGVGKSTMSVNMAILLQQIERKNILLIDADIHLGNVDLLLGIQPEYTIADVINRDIELDEAIINAPGGIDILPASGSAMELLEMREGLLQELSRAFARYNHDYDFVLVDTGAGIAKTVISFLLGADKMVLIMTPDPASIAEAYALIKVVRHFEHEMPIMMVINLVKSFTEGETLFKKMTLMVKKFLNSSIEFGGVVLKNDIIAASVQQQRPFVLDYPRAASTKTLRLVNHKLTKLPIARAARYHNFFDRFILKRKLSLEANL